MIADIFKVMLIDKVTKDVFASTTMESAGFEITSETTDVEGGGGIVAVIHAPRKESITLTDVRYDFPILAKQLGTDIVIGAGVAYTFPKEYTVVADATDEIITLDQVPIKASDVKIYDADGELLVATTDYTIAGAEVVFVAATVGDTIKVDGYTYTTSATTGTIEINNNNYPNGMICVLETLEIAEDETPLNKIQIVFDNTVFDGGTKINTATKRDAARHDMNLKVLNKVGDNVAGRILRIPLV